MSAHSSLHAVLSRWRRFPRTIRPAREGWWYLSITMAVGVAATNTGNNLLYLILSMCLAGLIVSGLLSEQSLRGVSVRREMARPLFAGRPAFGRLLVSNGKRRLRSFSVRVREVGSSGTARPLAYLPHLAPGAGTQLGYQARFERRGPAHLDPVQITTAFPFGLFVKSTRPWPGEEVLVFPRIEPLPGDVIRALGEAGASARPVQGLGVELHDLRLFRVGDDPRLIHWKQSAKLDRPIVRELESEEGGRVTLILEDPAGPPEDDDETERMEEDIRFAASLAAHVIRTDGEIEIYHGGKHWPAFRGEAELFHFLEYLARYAPPVSGEMTEELGPSASGSEATASVTVWLGKGFALVPGPLGEGSRLMRIALPAQEPLP